MLRCVLISAMLLYPLLACPLAAQVQACAKIESCCCRDTCGCEIESAPARQPGPPVAPVEYPSGATPLVLAYLCHVHATDAAHVAPVTLPESRVPPSAADDLQPLLCVWLT